MEMILGAIESVFRLPVSVAEYLEYLDGSVRASATNVSYCRGEAGPEAAVA